MFVERSTLRFGARNSDGTLAWCGVPGPASTGGAATTDGGDGLAALGFANTAEQAALRLSIPKRGGMFPSAISIAPDSAIHACDIALGGQNGEVHRHRISPGNPLIGNIAADFAMVTLPNAMPGIIHSATTIQWDASVVPTTGFTAGNAQWPLRLELWYGGLPIRGIYRAPYTAYGIFRTTGSAQERAMNVCVDGRKRVDVHLVCDGITNGLVTMQAWSMEAWKIASQPTVDGAYPTLLVLNDNGDTTLTLDPTTNILTSTVSFFGNPMQSCTSK
jgi:hypothetical protein